MNTCDTGPDILDLDFGFRSVHLSLETISKASHGGPKNISMHYVLYRCFFVFFVFFV